MSCQSSIAGHHALPPSLFKTCQAPARRASADTTLHAGSENRFLEMGIAQILPNPSWLVSRIPDCLRGPNSPTAWAIPKMCLLRRPNLTRCIAQRSSCSLSQTTRSPDLTMLYHNRIKEITSDRRPSFCEPGFRGTVSTARRHHAGHNQGPLTRALASHPLALLANVLKLEIPQRPAGEAVPLPANG